MFEAEPGLMIWTIISFCVLLVLLRTFAYKPILNMIRQREDTIQASLDEAKRTKEEAEELHAKYRGLITEARDEAKKIIDEGKLLGEKARKEMIQKADEESNRIVKRTQEQIAMEKDRALSELRDHVADLTIAAASKVINRSLSKEDHMKLLEEYVSKLGGINGQ